jgi:hypothetical protein
VASSHLSEDEKQQKKLEDFDYFFPSVNLKNLENIRSF